MAWGLSAVNRRIKKKGIVTSRPPERGLNQRLVPLTKSKLPSSKGINQRFAREIRRGANPSTPPTPIRKNSPVLSSNNHSGRTSSRNFVGSRTSGGGGGGLSGMPPEGGGFQGSQGDDSGGDTNFQDPGQSLEQQAKDLLALEFGPKKSALQRAIEAARKQFAQEETAQKGFGDIHDKRLQEIYTALTGQLQQGQGARQQIYDSSSSEVGNILDKAKGSVEGASKESQTGLQEMAARLGLQAGLGEPTAKLSNDAAALSGLLSAEKGNVLSGLSAEKANQLNFGQGGIDMSNREQASQRTDLSQSVAKALQELGISRNQAENEYQGELADLTAQEGPQLRKIMGELAEAEKQNEMDEFARMIQEETLNIQRGRLGLTARGQDQDYALGTARLGIDQAKLGLQAQKMQLEQERASTTDPLKQAKLAADIRNIDSQIASRNAPKAGAKSKYGKSQVGLDAFVNDKVKANAIKNPQRFRSTMAGLIANVDKKVGNNFSGTGKGIDPYTEAVRWINANGKRAKISTNLLKQAAAIYYGKA